MVPVPLISYHVGVTYSNLRRSIRGNDFRSGKTAAFAIPILQALLETPQKLFALVLTPTRELAFQIGEQFEALGASIGVLVGTFLLHCRGIFSSNYSVSVHTSSL